MAHYMAKNGSRFLYSHDTCHMSVYGIDNLVTNKPMQMNFHKIKNTQIAAHAAMNYYYRPKEMKDFCYYQFISDLRVISRREATISQQESFEFLDDHPLQSVNVVVYRQNPCIPIFAWNWLGSTKKFDKPLTEVVGNTNRDYAVKEEYAYKFMLLFLPLREHSDLIIDGSYQKGWLHAFHMKRFSEDMVEIAENIQTIHNSLESSIPTNTLTTETTLKEDEDDYANNYSSDSDDENELLSNIGELFASTSGERRMTEDSNDISPKFKSKYTEKLFPPVGSESGDNGITEIVLESVIQQHEPEILNPMQQGGIYYTERFRTTVTELNTLFNQCVITRNDETMDEGEPNEKQIVNATGSCESIQAWGENEKLDLEQQTAFEIVTASYILTFYNEANCNGGISHDDVDYVKRIKDLQTLARRSDPRKKLRMFVTGPAGAGKCKNLFCINKWFSYYKGQW